jgi:hypothetical protein
LKPSLSFSWHDHHAISEIEILLRPYSYTLRFLFFSFFFFFFFFWLLFLFSKSLFLASHACNYAEHIFLLSSVHKEMAKPNIVLVRIFPFFQFFYLCLGSTTTTSFVNFDLNFEYHQSLTLELPWPWL